MVCRSQSGDRGCSGCKVKAGDLQLMGCIVPAANTTSLCAVYWECHPSRVMSIYLCKIHCQVKIFCVCGDTCTWIIKAGSTLWPGNASVTAMTWDLLNAWKWSGHIPKSFWARLPCQQPVFVSPAGWKPWTQPESQLDTVRQQWTASADLQASPLLKFKWDSKVCKCHFKMSSFKRL